MKLFFERYRVNLESILTSIEPEGHIAKQRFISTLNSLGAEYSAELLEVLLGIMAVSADSLQKLHYRELFKSYE
jgi:hypothetical protein